MCNRLHTISACDGQTDGQTDIFPRHSPRYAYALRVKIGFASVGGRNSPFPITLAIGLYNSLYYRTSRDKL